MSKRVDKFIRDSFEAAFTYNTPKSKYDMEVLDKIPLVEKVCGFILYCIFTFVTNLIYVFYNIKGKE